MKKSMIFLATLASVTTVTLFTSNNKTVKADTLNIQDVNSIKVSGPITNAPLHKYISNVLRYGSWTYRDGADINNVNTTPSKVYYNDGEYSGYLYRKNTWMEHNFKTNKNRWVSEYAGRVRLISHGLVPGN